MAKVLRVEESKEAQIPGTKNALWRAFLDTPYQNAHEHLFNESLEQELQTVRLVVEHRLNAEAVEAFLRRQDRPHILTLKMQLLVYLVELHASGYRLFVNEADARGRAALTILGALARWPYMLLKGAYLTWRYQLV